MIKAIIIEDELVSSRRLARLLKAYDYEIVANLISVRSSINWLKSNDHPDIIFMDVHLSDGLCFEIFNKVKVRSAIVFTTAYSQYSIKAFDYNSLSYLLKPIQKTQLERAILKTNKFHENRQEILALKDNIHFKTPTLYKKKFILNIGRKIKLVPIEKIVLFYSHNNSSFLFTNGMSYDIKDSLSQIMKDINPIQFFRVSRKYIINSEWIKSIKIYKNNRLLIELSGYEESEIIISRERVKDFKAWLS